MAFSKRSNAAGGYVNMEMSMNPSVAICAPESMQSMRCLEDNGYEKKACQAAFDNYNACKKFWGKVVILRRQQRISPEVPDPEDRKDIKARYLATGKISATGSAATGASASATSSATADGSAGSATADG